MKDNEPKRTLKKGLPKAVKICVDACKAKKAEDIIVLNLKNISSFTDYFIIMHGNSPKQNTAIHENVERTLKGEKTRPLSVEGVKNAEWILMDYGSFILHIFSEKAREYYSLESLWGDGIREDIG